MDGMDGSNQHEHQAWGLPPMQPWFHEAILFIERTLHPDGDSVEQDIATLFPDDNIDIDHDFANQGGLRYLGSWDGANAYRATAAWMYTVGADVYKAHVPRIQGAGYEACQEIERRAPPPKRPSRRLDIDPNSQNKESVIDYTAVVQGLLKDQDTSWKGLLPTYHQYRTYKEAYFGLHNQMKREEKIGILAHDFEYQPFIKGMYLAAQDMSDTMENPRMVSSQVKKGEGAGPDGQFKDAVAVSRVKELKSLELELLCWEIFEEAWYHQQRQSNIPHWYDQHNKKPKTYATLVERVNDCIEAMRYSKSAIKSMLTISFPKRLAYDPTSELKRKKGNKMLNQKRDTQNKMGIYAQQKGLVTVDDQSRSITASGGQQIRPAHPLAQSLLANAAESPDGSQQSGSPGSSTA